MSYFGKRYVVDTNTLTQLGDRRRANAIFLESAVIPEEVLFEASEFPDLESLRGNVHPTTPRMLHWLIRILDTVLYDDTRLINLYANQGNADPLLVACALEGQEHDNDSLLPCEWIVVSADGAVRAKAKAFGLKVLSNAEFAAIIDEADDEQ